MLGWRVTKPHIGNKMHLDLGGRERCHGLGFLGSRLWDGISMQEAYWEALLRSTPWEGKEMKHDWAERGIESPTGQWGPQPTPQGVWRWEDPSELFWTRARGQDFCTPPWSVNGFRWLWEGGVMLGEAALFSWSHPQKGLSWKIKPSFLKGDLS